MVNFNFKLIAFNASNINEEKTLAAGRELAARFKSEAPLDVETFINDARVKAGWPVATRLLKRAIENGKINEIVAALVVPVKVPEMITIPAGKFVMGSTKCKNEQPIREVKITKAFALGRYEVTNEEYKSYLEATKQLVPELVADSSKAKHPVVNVSWNDAVTYCQWLSKETGESYRLPTEAEWEYAARGTEGRVYPYGNVFDASKCNLSYLGTTPVGAYPEGAGPFGNEDMSGNVYEWTGDWYADKYNPDDLTDPKVPINGTLKVVIRSGSWNNHDSDSLRGASRLNGNLTGRDNLVGFRIAKDLK